MRVVVGLRSLHPGKVGGLETYVRALLSAWARDTGGAEWVVLANRATAPALESAPGMTVETVDDEHDLAAWRRAAEARGPAVYFSPMLVIDPPTVGLPTAVTIPDLQHEFFPEYYDEATLAFRRLHYALSARRADAVLTLSDHAARSIVEKLGAPAEKVHPILLAADDAFHRPVTDAEAAAFRERHGLPEEFGYFPANFWKHKNHEGLFAALAHYRRRWGDPPLIALSGFAGGDQSRIEKAVARLGLADRIRILGYLRRDEIPAAYAAARFLVFPSRFEGFGLPVAEAMAVGCPVACARASSIPEFAGDAVRYFNPDRPAEIAEAMRELVTDDGLRGALATRGRARSAELTWDACARRTREVLAGVWEHATRPVDLRLEAVVVDESGGASPRSPLPEAAGGRALCFVPEGGEVPFVASEVMRAFRRHPVPVLAAPGGADEPDFDLLSLKSGDPIRLTRLVVSPGAAAGVLAWLQAHPGASHYATVLAIAREHLVADAPELPVPAGRLSSDPGPLAGGELSLAAFGVTDRAWLQRIAAASPPARLAAAMLGRAEPPRRLVRRLRPWAEFRLTGRLKLRPRAALTAWLAARRPSFPTVDGWIGGRGRLTLSPDANGRLALTLDSPAWPWHTPPHVRVRAGGCILYDAPLEGRGAVRLRWPWPAPGADKIEVRVEVNRTFVPADHGAGEDERALAIRVLPG